MHYDIVIIGAGPAGLGFGALAAEQGFRVAVFDRQQENALARPKNDGRDIAISEKSRRILEGMGAWAHIPAKDISPIRAAKVLDGHAPFALNFDPARTGADRLGQIISNHLIRKALYKVARVKAGLTLFAGCEVKALHRQAGHVELVLSDGRVMTGALAVAADTRFSKIRREAGIKAQQHDFGQTMIVGRMYCGVPHHHIAWEMFRYDGGLAVLPLNHDMASIVQTFPAEKADTYMAMSDADYAAASAARLGHLLGALQIKSPRVAYPLVGVYAQKFYDHRLVLIGDAAVGMHPVTAHGFNFGIQGVADLARRLAGANDPGLSPALSAWARTHRRRTWPLYQFTEKLIGLYTTNTLPARIARKAGLHLAEHAGPAKDLLMAKLTGTPAPALLIQHLPKPPFSLPGL